MNGIGVHLIAFIGDLAYWIVLKCCCFAICSLFIFVSVVVLSWLYFCLLFCFVFCCLNECTKCAYFDVFAPPSLGVCCCFLFSPITCDLVGFTFNKIYSHSIPLIKFIAIQYKYLHISYYLILQY
jgi:hypothetical protein